MYQQQRQSVTGSPATTTTASALNNLQKQVSAHTQHHQQLNNAKKITPSQNISSLQQNLQNQIFQNNNSQNKLSNSSFPPNTVS